MKKAAVFLMILLLLTMISACSQTKQASFPETCSVNPESEPYSSSESPTEESVVVSSSDTTSSPETESTAPSTSEPPEEQSPDSTTSHTASILQSPAESETPSNTTAPSNTPPARTYSTEGTQQAETKPPSQAEQPKPEVPSDPPVQGRDPQPESPTTEEQTNAPVEEPAFDISYWVQYARSYAVSVGLQLHEEAIYCWDTPISANAKCLYLERDIQSRLNRYAGDEEITLVWIWTAELSEGNYEIYIGYA